MTNTSPSTTLSTALDLDDLLEHAGWLRRLARSLVLDDGEADDVVQETWLAAIRQGDGERRQPRAWLAGTLRKVVLMRRRGEGRRRARESEVAYERDGAVAAGLSSAKTVSRERALLECVASLPETQRSAVVARYFEGLSPRAIARRDGLRLDTVKSRLKRGLAGLRGQLHEQHGDRRAWSTWLLPLASAHRNTAGVAAAVWGVLAVAAAGAVATLAISLGGSAAASKDSRSLAVQEVGAEAPATNTVAALEGAAPRGRAALDVPMGTTEVRVLAGPGGAPAAGASVAYLEISSADVMETISKAAGPRLDDIERVMHEHGTWQTADDEGLATIEATAPYMLRAGTELTVCYSPQNEAVGSIEMTLRRAVRIRVEVSDADGNPVDGIPVSGELSIDRDGQHQGLDGPRTFTFERLTEGGQAIFQDPMGFTAVEAQYSKSIEWTRFHVVLPGVPETTPGALKSTSIRLKRKLDSQRTISLRMPPTAPLRLEIAARDDERTTLVGTARLRVVNGRYARHFNYQVQIIDGRAEWPRVALGIDVEVEVLLPGMGTRWEVTGRSSERVNNLAKISTSRPHLPTWRGRMVDADGAPRAGLTVCAYYRERESGYSRNGMYVTTDADGAFRFQWDNPTRVDGPFYLEVRSGMERGVLALDVARAMVHGDHDLGALELALAVQPDLVGRCVDGDGNPIPGLDVAASQIHGGGFGCMTDEEGRFAMGGIYGATCPLEIYDPEDRFARLHLELSLPQRNGGPDIVLSRGAKLVGHIDVPAFLGTQHRLRITMERHGTSGYAGVQVDEDGYFEKAFIEPGTWDAKLRLSGNAPLVEMSGIELLDGETTKLEIPRLDALLRPVEFVVTGVPERIPVTARVFGPTGRLLRIRLGDGPLPVPTTGRWSVRISAADRRSVTIADAASLGDEVEVHLTAPIRVALTMERDAPPGFTFSLVGEPGSPAEGESVSIPLDRLQDGRLEIAFPSPGSYRLTRGKVESNPGRGAQILDAKAHDSTTEVIQIPDGDGPYEIGIRLDAPPTDR